MQLWTVSTISITMPILLHLKHFSTPPHLLHKKGGFLIPVLHTMSLLMNNLTSFNVYEGPDRLQVSNGSHLLILSLLLMVS
jgi:hypothetical protein